MRFLHLGASLRVSEEVLRRLFQGLDVTNAGLLGCRELLRAFAQAAPRLSRPALRRRLMLAFGGLQNLIRELEDSNQVGKG